MLRRQLARKNITSELRRPSAASRGCPDAGRGESGERGRSAPLVKQEAGGHAGSHSEDEDRRLCTECWPSLASCLRAWQRRAWSRLGRPQGDAGALQRDCLRQPPPAGQGAAPAARGARCAVQASGAAEGQGVLLTRSPASWGPVPPRPPACAPAQAAACLPPPRGSSRPLAGLFGCADPQHQPPPAVPRAVGQAAQGTSYSFSCACPCLPAAPPLPAALLQEREEQGLPVRGKGGVLAPLLAPLQYPLVLKVRAGGGPMHWGAAACGQQRAGLLRVEEDAAGLSRARRALQSSSPLSPPTPTHRRRRAACGMYWSAAPAASLQPAAQVTSVKGCVQV